MLHTNNIIKTIGNILYSRIDNSSIADDIYKQILNQRRYNRILLGKGWKNKI